MTQIRYQIKGKCFIYHISTELKQIDHPLTNYSYPSNPTPKMYIHAKKMYFFLLFFIWHMPNDIFHH